MTNAGSMKNHIRTVPIRTSRHVSSQQGTWPGAWDLLSRDALQARGWEENKDGVVSLSIIIKLNIQSCVFLQICL